VPIRYRLLLPIIGLVLFGMGTYESVRFNREAHPSEDRYFWWVSIRLDSDPQSRHHRVITPAPCIDGTSDCVGWNGDYMSVHPGPLAQILEWSALPAFLTTAVVVLGLAKLGVSEAVSFMICAPALIAAWYYLIGWWLDRWRDKRRQYTAALATGK
jgi:hypothetical protein